MQINNQSTPVIYQPSNQKRTADAAILKERRLKEIVERNAKRPLKPDFDDKSFKLNQTTSSVESRERLRRKDRTGEQKHFVFSGLGKSTDKKTVEMLENLYKYQAVDQTSCSRLLAGIKDLKS